MTASLRLSIITPSLNRAGYIADAIASVVAQGYSATEHIVVDGGSTDGTLGLLARYPQIRIVSGRDQGMYDALNKGLALTTGDVVGLLNSDDLYADTVFPEVMSVFEDERILAVAGRALVFSESPDGTRSIVGRFSPGSASLLEHSTIGSPYINAWFFRRSVFGRIGRFNTEYRIAADRDFMLRAALCGLEYTTLDCLVYEYRQHAGSMTFNLTDRKLEQVVREHILMTSRYLRQVDLSREARRFIREARTQDTLAMAMRCSRNRKLRKVLFYAAAGLRFDLGWGFKYARRAMMGVIRLAS